MPALPDHVLVFVLLLVLPVLGAKFGLRRIRERILSGKPDPRVRAYVSSMLQQWTLAAASLFVWTREGRPFARIGLGAPEGTGFWITAAAAALGVWFLHKQAAAVAEDPELQERVRVKLGRSGAVIPRSPRERAFFVRLSVTAGICEELLYRGYLTWYLAAYLPLVAAFLVAPLAFGFGHAYQGARGILLTALIGLAMSALYALGGSIWVPMAFHAAFDIQNGRLGSQAFAGAEDAAGLASAQGG